MNLSTICTHLPGQWSVRISVVDGDLDGEIVRSDGLALWFCQGGYGNKGRIAINFVRPRGADGKNVTLWADKSPDKIVDPRITVADTKTEEQIANDIVRRLLPDAEKVFALAITSINAHNKFEVDKVWAINKIAFHCRTEPDRHYQTKELTGKIDPYNGAKVEPFQENGYGEFRVHSKNSIDLELNGMNIDLAVEVAEALREILSRRAFL